MLNKKKSIIFVGILLICIIGIMTKDKILPNEDTYVLTDEKSQEENIENEEQKNKIDNEESTVSNKKITVYVSGAVKKPGMVTLNEGERLGTAVEKVGGTTKKADLNNVNLALKLKDEVHYIIPKEGEKLSTTSQANDNQSTNENNNSNTNNNNINNNNENNEGESSNSSKININTATIEELDKLPGVGEATANKIANYRDENGNFKSIEEIKNVNGIGDKQFEDMKDLICVD